MRLNEICQLDIADIILMDGVHMFSVSQTSPSGTGDKRLKTKASERFVPCHPIPLDLGLMAFVEGRRRSGTLKLFDDIPMDATGYRSSTFSSWFTRFLRSANASAPKTCYHSFRHSFRDGLRQARVDRDIVMALGGWASGSSSASSSSDVYGAGYHAQTLFEEISKLKFPPAEIALSAPPPL
jgi:integrase